MTTTELSRDAWVDTRHERTRVARVTLRAIRAHGEPGTGGEPGKRRPMTQPTADLILELVQVSGIIGLPGRGYLIACIRFHYGYRLHAPVSPYELNALEAAHIRRRAWELVDHARDERRGPHVDHEGPYAG